MVPFWGQCWFSGVYLPQSDWFASDLLKGVLVDLWQGGSLSKLDGVLEIDMSDTQDGREHLAPDVSPLPLDIIPSKHL